MKNSVNATFLFFRDFMEYHSDRFQDYSLLFFRKNKLIAILPANVKGNEVYSHAGLTYGGIITKGAINTTEMGAMLDALIEYLRGQGIKQLHLKIMPPPIPEAYSNALEYFLFLKNAKLEGRDLNYVVDLRNEIAIHKSKLKKLNSMEPGILEIRETTDLSAFWQEVLIPVLRESHEVDPVHSLEEIQRLRSDFPTNIRQVDVYHQGVIVAGMTLFISNGVVKSQYGAATTEGKELRALDYLYLQLFEKYKQQGFRYFDMGTSSVAKGASYNIGLSKYKEEFGAQPVNLDHYQLSL